VHVYSFKIDDYRHLKTDAKFSSRQVGHLTDLPFVRETERFFLRYILYNEVVEDKPRTFEIVPSFSVGD